MAVFTVVPEEIREIRSHRTLLPPVGDSGMVHRRNALPPGLRMPRRWSVLWHTATVAERDAIAQLYDDTHGGAISFDWSPPGEAAIVAHFVEDSFSWDAVSGNRFDTSVIVEETR